MMGSKRMLWIGLIIGVLVLIVTVCVSCGALVSSLSEYTEQIPEEIGEESDIVPEPMQGVDYQKLPTPALKFDIPAFAEGQLPVGAVVQIIVDGLVSGYSEQWSGSGTIISPDGLILTNAHVAVGDRFYRADRLTIGLTIAEDQPPVPAYIAEVVQADTNLDIAVLRIVKDLTGRRINTTDLNLPYVEIGNSDDLRLGDDITIMGYPGIGGQTITLTSGKVSGFTSEAAYGNRAFIKTSATIAGGNSGGMATDDANRLVGIPTQVGAGDLEGEVVDCRPLADTNRDGYIDDYDTCVPTGGFINALRPVNLAIPLINAAIDGSAQYVISEENPTPAIPSGGEIVYTDDFSSDQSGWPVESDNSEAFYYQSGRYYIEINKSNHLRPITGGEYLQDVVISIDTRVESSSGNGDYGVLCRYADGDNFYMFEITQDAFYAIYAMINSEWFPLIDYTYSPMLENVNNPAFEVSCVGDTLSFAVNDVLLGTVKDTTIKAGDYGIFAGTFDNPGNIISFDNLKVQLP
jgi:S1-C subfamily serine protease